MPWHVLDLRRLMMVKTSRYSMGRKYKEFTTVLKELRLGTLGVGSDKPTDAKNIFIVFATTFGSVIQFLFKTSFIFYLLLKFCLFNSLWMICHIDFILFVDLSNVQFTFFLPFDYRFKHFFLMSIISFRNFIVCLWFYLNTVCYLNTCHRLRRSCMPPLKPKFNVGIVTSMIDNKSYVGVVVVVGEMSSPQLLLGTCLILIGLLEVAL